MARTYALLDCNALNYLVRPAHWMSFDATRVRRRLRARVRRGDLRLLATPCLIVQVASTALSDRPKAKSMLALLHDLSDGVILQERIKRIEAERGALRRLDVSDMLMPNALADQTWRRIAERVLWDQEVHRRLQDEIDEGKRVATFFERTIPELRSKLGGTSGGATTKWRRWYDLRPDVVDYWCDRFSKESELARRIASDGRGWPPPKDVPSVWNYVAYHLSHVVLTNTGQIRPDRGDRGDVALYSEAAYADVLVTDDKDMRQVIANVRGDRVPVQKIQEFVADWAT